MQGTFKVESSKLLAWISKVIGIKFKSLQKLQETINQRNFTNSSLQSPEELSLQTFKFEEHSKRNHPNHIPRSQSSLELSSKASRNLNKPQISEALRIQASKASKNFYHKPSNTKNIWRGIIQIIFLDLKGHWNQAQKPPETSTNHKLVKLYGFKPPNPRRTSATNLQIRRTFEAESFKLPA